MHIKKKKLVTSYSRIYKLKLACVISLSHEFAKSIARELSLGIFYGPVKLNTMTETVVHNSSSTIFQG